MSGLGPWRHKNCKFCDEEFFAANTRGLFCSKLCKWRQHKIDRYFREERRRDDEARATQVQQ